MPQVRVIALGNVGPLPPRRRKQELAKIRSKGVVAVHKGHVLASGGLNAGVAGAGDTPVALMPQNAHPRVGLCVTAQHRQGIIRAAVVHAQHLDICHGLSQYAA